MSLNEVEALAKKATRGAGYPWGIAEEAGKGVRWLCAVDIDGCAALADLLEEADGSKLSDRAPLQGNAWTSPSGRLCPLLAGAALSDLAETLNGRELRLESVARPILLAPFAALSARGIGSSLHLEWDDARVATDGETLTVEGSVGAMSADVTVRVGAGSQKGEAQAARSRAAPEADVLAALNRLAHRTYAPATEASRLSGAGAGLSDTD